MRLLAVALALAFSSISAADETEDVGAAKARFAAGTAFFKQQRYRDAVSEFLQAYRLSKADDLLYNIGICYDALEDAGRATIYFDRYLAARPAAAERGEIEQSLYRASSRVGRLIIHAPPNAEVTVDGVPIEIAPPAPLPVTQGRRHVEAIVSGSPPMAADVDVSGGLSREVTLLPLTGGPIAPTAEAPHRRRWVIPVVISAVLVVAAAITVGVLFGAPGGTDFHAQGLHACDGKPGCELYDYGGAR
jgi:hypothetical protein